MNSKRLFKKMLSLFLVLMLALCTLSTGVLAEDEGGGGGASESESLSVDTDSGNSGNSSSAGTPSDTPESGGSDAESGSGSSDDSGDSENTDQPADPDKTDGDASTSENQESVGGDSDDGDSEKTVNKDENSQQNSDSNVTNPTTETPADGAAEDTSDKKATEEKTKDSAESTDNGKEQSDEDENKKSWLGSISDAVSGTVSNIKESVSETVSDIISDSILADIFPSMASFEDGDDEEESDNVAPKISDDDYIYFDLALGNVTINDTEIKGWVYEESETGEYKEEQKTYSSDSDEYKNKQIYIYQSNGSPDTDASTWKNGLPVYDRVIVESKSWGEYITNNTYVQGVIDKWESSSGRAETANYITISGNKDFNITIDNLYSTAQLNSYSRYEGNGGIICHRESKGNTVINLKGDNRFARIHYDTQKNAAETSLTFKDADDSGDATLTAANTVGNAGYNHWNSAIGSVDSNNENTVGLVFESGIIYAGTTSADNCSAIGAGGNGYGEITIKGATVTAVTSSTGTAIGGGIGYNQAGGEGKVTISEGTVYAYNFGYEDIPAAAIGGGSSKSSDGSNATVTISGGTVYAESVGGTAIGGGGSATKNGGDVELTISGDANVTAKSVSGSNMSAGAGIGGGTSNATSGYTGGSANVTISGGTVTTGSIGGGKGAALGSATVNISGGTVQGQVVMSGGTGSTAGSFTMTSGTIDNSGISEYTPLEDGGGALHIENGTAEISGGKITNCTANGDGGAVYINYSGSGDSTTNAFTMTGGELTGNTAKGNGGAVYVTSSDSNVSVLIEGGKITENKAVNGGGIAVEPASGYIANVVIGCSGCNGAENATHTAHPDISGNTASGTGGGVYISGSDENSSNVTMYCGEIASNTLANGTSNDVTQTGGKFTNAGGTIKKDPTVTGGEYNDTSASGGDSSTEYIYYKVVYHANRTTDDTTNDTETIEVKISEPAGTETDHTWNAITLPGSNQFTKANCYISGWKTSLDSTDENKYSVNSKVVLYDLKCDSDNEEIDGKTYYIINFYAVWAQEVVEAGSDASYVVTIPAALSIGTDGSSQSAEVTAKLENFTHDNWLNVTVISSNSYELFVNSVSKNVFYWLCLDGDPVTTDTSDGENDLENSLDGTNEESSDGTGAAALEESTSSDGTVLSNGGKVISVVGQSVKEATITQNIIAKLRDISTPVTVAGTYTDILTFTVNFG